jgi:O-antigen/teichoic acid export membrane protein
MWNKIVKNTLWLTSGEVIGRLIRAVLVIYAARILGASDWGTFSYVLSLAALFTLFADAGLGAVLTRELVKYPGQQTQYFSTSFFIKLFFLLAASLGIIFLIPIFTKINLPQNLIILTAFLVIFDSLRVFSFSITRALEKMHLEAIINIITQIAIVGLGLWALVTIASIESLALAYVVGSGVGLLVSIFIIRDWLKKISSNFNRSLVKKIIYIAWPFALLGMLTGVILNTDIIMLGWLKEAQDIGFYSVAQKIILVLYAFPALIATSSFPAFTRLANNKDTKEFSNLIVKSLKVIFMMSLPITAGGMIVGFDFIDLIFGSAYHASVTTFQILLLSLVINFPITIIGNALFAHNKQNEFIKYSSLAAGSNIIFNFLFIPIWGIEGAAISTISTQLISNTFIWFKMKQVNDFKLGNRLNKILIATIIMSALVWLMQLLNIVVWAIIPIAILIYLLALKLLKETALQSLLEAATKRAS